MSNVVDELERLAGLLEKGLLSRDEFENQKAILLRADSPTGSSNVVEAEHARPGTPDWHRLV